jgi:hypothetical protein
MNNNFEIKDAVLGNEVIGVTILTHEFVSKNILINRFSFERWVKDSNKLDFSNSFINPTDFFGMGEDTGNLSLKEYWSSGDNVTSDLYDFIIKNNLHNE